jgi:enolase
MKIKKVFGREILNCRGIPAVECCIVLGNDVCVSASVPSGISRGKLEAHELYDGDKKRYRGMGVLEAVKKIEDKIAPLILGKEPDFKIMDKLFVQEDGTSQKDSFGANTILAASIAVLKAQAKVAGMEVYELLSQIYNLSPSLPSVMFNMISGGAHSSNNIVFQECMVMPKLPCFSDSLHAAVSIYYSLKDILEKKGYKTGVRDEGSFSPLFIEKDLPEKQALDMLMSAIEASGYTVDDIDLCLDVAASHFYDSRRDCYSVRNKELSSSDMIAWYEELARQYPIFSIEDGLDQEDWNGWGEFTKKHGSMLQIVGDDLFVTNVSRITNGIKQKVANAVIIKPNQIGSVSEAIDAILLCQKSGYKTIISHRSGETNDSFIADLVVGMSGKQFKAGAPARGERVAKYNRLLQIESKLL